MVAVTESAAGSSALEPLPAVEKRVVGLLEQARTSFAAVRWRDAGTEKFRIAEWLLLCAAVQGVCWAQVAEACRLHRASTSLVAAYGPRSIDEWLPRQKPA